ncbi:MAG: 30S ribosomal protein S2 [Desulfocapsa sp.]|nr:30S ribosomal protein S2 [Desulfocapsa sp.]
MENVTVKEMLQAGLHFGHQTRRWNPKMKPYIYGPRNGIYIINLDKSKRMFDTASDFVINEIAQGGKLLFVGTKRQARMIIREEAVRCQMPYVDHRWLGGMMTNFQTIKNSIERLKSIESMQEDGSINRFPKKEILLMEKERVKLERNVGGIKHLRKTPTAILIIDPRNEAIAINEAQKLNIPVIALADTNCDPDGIDYLIPGNDDAIRSIRLICNHLADSVLAGQAAREGEDASDEAMLAAMADAGAERAAVADVDAEQAAVADAGAEQAAVVDAEVEQPAADEAEQPVEAEGAKD